MSAGPGTTREGRTCGARPKPATGRAMKKLRLLASRQPALDLLKVLSELTRVDIELRSLRHDKLEIALQF